MYKVAKDGDIVLAIRNVLARYKSVRSQRELRDRVEQELNFGGGNYSISGSRVRRLAVVSGVARLKVMTKATGREGEMFDCPVCSEKLAASRNRTLYGKSVTMGYRCLKCEYWTEKSNLRLPSRYEFSMKRRR